MQPSFVLCTFSHPLFLCPVFCIPLPPYYLPPPLSLLPGSIHKDSAAAQYLLERGVARKDFNSYGSRRGNDEVMTRGTFANIRLVNKMLGGEVGPYALHVPSGEKMRVFDAAMVRGGGGGGAGEGVRDGQTGREREGR